MYRKEDYTPLVTVALGLALAILVTFQIYIWREPARILADEDADHIFSVASGEALYVENCVNCHGEHGEGGLGPALNSRDLLQMTSDDVFFSLTRTGIPGTIMPAWGQQFGGPFTDEQAEQIVDFIRAWEPTAPEMVLEVEEPDPARGAAIFSQTCIICHGQDGSGTAEAPAINDPERLQNLEDAWYRSTIANGRPAKGMPTWGTVLSPAQINDLVALIATWRSGETVAANIPLVTLVTNSLFAMRQFDQPDTLFFLNAASAVVDSERAAELQAIITLVEENHLFEAEGRLIALLPPEEMGQAMYNSNCAPCHGDDGTGGLGPNLHTNTYLQSQTDEELIAFILAGRSGTAMDSFEGILSAEDLVNLVALLRTWQQ